MFCESPEDSYLKGSTKRNLLGFISNNTGRRAILLISNYAITHLRPLRLGVPFS